MLGVKIAVAHAGLALKRKIAPNVKINRIEV